MKNSMGNLPPAGSSSAMNVSPNASLSETGTVSSASVHQLPMDAGLVLVLRRNSAAGLVTQEAWPLRGGLWDLGAARIPVAYPAVFNPRLLDASIQVAECFRSAVASEAEGAQGVGAMLAGLPVAERDGALAQGLELLGVSNRQIFSYAQQNLFMLSGGPGSAECCDLLVAALRARAALDQQMTAGFFESNNARFQAGLQSAVDSVELGARNAGLSEEDAQRIAADLMSQLNVFSGPPVGILRAPSVSEADLESGGAALGAQEPLTAPMDNRELLAVLTGQRSGSPAAGQPSAALPAALPVPDRLRVEPPTEKRPRSAPPRFDQTEHVSGRMRLDDGSALASRLDVMLTTEPGQPQFERVLSQLKLKLSGPLRLDGENALRSQVRQMKADLHAAGLVSPATWLERHQRFINEQVRSGALARMNLLRAEAVSQLRGFNDRNRSAISPDWIREMSAANLAPVPIEMWTVPPVSRSGQIMRLGDSGSLIAYRAEGFAAIGSGEVEVAGLMRDMLDILLSSRIHSNMGQVKASPENAEAPGTSQAQSNARQVKEAEPEVSLAALARAIMEPLDGFRYSPRRPEGWDFGTGSDQRHGDLPELLAACLRSELIDRILRLPAQTPVVAQQADWPSLVRLAAARLPDEATLLRALLGEDRAARDTLFRGVAYAFDEWRQSVQPNFDVPAHHDLFNQLTALANHGRQRGAPFSREEVVRRVQEQLWDFAYSGQRGGITGSQRFQPIESDALGYLQSALIEVMPQASDVHGVQRVLDSAVLALRSRDENAVGNILASIIRRANLDSEEFAREFIRDLGDARMPTPEREPN